jgi:hypothetical protein
VKPIRIVSLPFAVLVPDQVPGEHTVRFEVIKLPDDMSYYVGPLLIVGDILPLAK